MYSFSAICTSKIQVTKVKQDLIAKDQIIFAWKEEINLTNYIELPASSLTAF